jgi:hypothetical protein
MVRGQAPHPGSRSAYGGGPVDEDQERPQNQLAQTELIQRKAIAIRDDAPRERVPMIGRPKDMKKRRRSSGASSVCCAN